MRHIQDYMFGMTAQAKAELVADLSNPVMFEALQWVRTGGYYFCANLGETCTCPGQVRRACLRSSRRRATSRERRILRRVWMPQMDLRPKRV